MTLEELRERGAKLNAETEKHLKEADNLILDSKLMQQNEYIQFELSRSNDWLKKDSFMSKYPIFAKIKGKDKTAMHEWERLNHVENLMVMCDEMNRLLVARYPELVIEFWFDRECHDAYMSKSAWLCGLKR